MKNRHKELLRLKAKLHKPDNRNWLSDSQCSYPYLFDDERTISYWTDFGLYIGKTSYHVSWTHPRYDYHNECQNAAYDLVKQMQDDTKLFDKSTPNYRKVGKSRKKISSYTMGEIGNRGFYDAWDKAGKELTVSGNIVSKCKFKIEKTAYGKWVNICIPFGAVTSTTLKALRDEVEAYIRNPLLFVEKYGDYTYTKEDWKADCELYPELLKLR